MVLAFAKDTKTGGISHSDCPQTGEARRRRGRTHTTVANGPLSSSLSRPSKCAARLLVLTKQRSSGISFLSTAHPVAFSPAAFTWTFNGMPSGWFCDGWQEQNTRIHYLTPSFPAAFDFFFSALEQHLSELTCELSGGEAVRTHTLLLPV